ncbi:MAG: exo-alpha-sialidase [Clostridia bacterium]|nr:exo-alpha-sialidase [Clostridia bacterium]
MKNINLENSVQISNGLTETSADGASLVFDKKYGIMFCAYMPGPQGNYGESRGRVSLSYFPASQPTNIRFVTISEDRDVYCPNALSLGEGKVRVLYEKDSKAEGNHLVCFKDFDYLSETLGKEKTVMLLKDDGNTVPLTETEQYAYLEKNGFTDYTYRWCEQIIIGSHTIFDGGDGYVYGAITSYVAQPVLYRSKDNMETLEFFAICPYLAQYEMDYKFLNGKIYAIFRTDKDIDSIGYTVSEDMGKTWSEPYYFENSIQCRPRLIISNNNIVLGYNYFNDDTGNRPKIQQGRTSVRLHLGKDLKVVADICSKCGIVNIALIDILNDVYMAYSTSELALEYQNGNPMVRGKDAIRYIKLGDLIPDEN